MIARQTPMTVSYTHLDVYKRQLLLCAALLGSCASAPASRAQTAPVTLHVCIDLDTSEKLENRLRAAFRRFHPDVELTVTQLPVPDGSPQTAERRASLAQEIRTQVMAGKGPDVFLLAAWPFPDVERLFPDLQKTMRTGAFLDLGPQLEQRSDWSPEDFPAPLFGAGTVDGAVSYTHLDVYKRQVREMFKGLVSVVSI